MFWMYLLKNGGTPLALRLSHIALWGTVSNALIIFINVMTSPSSSFIFVKALLRMATLFLQPSSFMNPFCLFLLLDFGS